MLKNGEHASAPIAAQICFLIQNGILLRWLVSCTVGLVRWILQQVDLVELVWAASVRLSLCLNGIHSDSATKQIGSMLLRF